MDFLKNKITIWLFVTTLLIIGMFAIFGMDAMDAYKLFLIMLIGYAVLWAIAIPYMIWSLLPGNRSKPLARKWKVIGFILLILGYTPAIFMVIQGMNKGWDVRDCIEIPLFFGPIFVYTVFKIKNRFVIEDSDEVSDEEE